MQTTKNKKVAKGIKILVTGPLYCAVFVSAGLGCFGTKKKIGIIALTQSEEDPIYTGNGTDEDTGGVGDQAFEGSQGSQTDEDNNVLLGKSGLEKSDAGEVSAEPREQPQKRPQEQPKMSPKAAVEKGSSKTDVLGKNGDPRSSDKLGSNITQTKPGGQKNRRDGNKVTDQSSKVNNGGLDSVEKEDGTQANSESLSLDNTTQQDRSLDRNLLPGLKDLKKKIDNLKNLKLKLTRLCKDNTHNGLLEDIDKFYNENSGNNILNSLQKLKEVRRQPYIDHALKVAKDYIKDVKDHIKQEEKARKK